MLKELTLSNFRIFDAPVTIRFRPITILIGRNSSGKSSIVKFLLMLQQSTEPGNSLYLTPEGSKTNLGLFRELKNFSTQKQHLDFILKVASDAKLTERLFALDSRDVHGINHDEIVYAVQAKISYEQRNQNGKAAYVVMKDNANNNFLKLAVTILNHCSSSSFMLVSCFISRTGGTVGMTGG